MGGLVIKQVRPYRDFDAEERIYRYIATLLAPKFTTCPLTIRELESRF